MRKLTVLLVDDEPTIRGSLRRLLANEGLLLLEAANGREAMALVAHTEGLPPPPGATLPSNIADALKIDLILSDIRMPEASGMDLLRYVRGHVPRIQIILLTAFGEVADAVTALKLGALNFLEKPVEPADLISEVQRAQLLITSREQGAPSTSKAERSTPRILGSSPAMSQLRDTIARAGSSDSTVLIQGESGTGKELVARALHEASPRASGPFVAVHCGAIPEALFESELFGHVRGAFTGALTAREGKFAQAEGGTIFLDEIGEMPLAMQVRLLRVLQERTYDPVGSPRSRTGNFRVIAATNRDLARDTAEGRFRADLFFRLNVLPIEVPPLRQRGDDVLELAAAFIESQNNQRNSSLELPDATCTDLLLRYSWPGNVRELEHLVERTAVMKGNGPLTAEDLPRMILDSVGRPNSPGGLRTMAGQAETGASPSSGTPPGPLTSPPLGNGHPVDLKEELNRLERALIIDALEQTEHNKNQAARLLGVNRTTLLEKMKRLGVPSTPRAS